MKLLIDIDDNVFTRLFDNGVDTSAEDRRVIDSAVRNGMPYEERPQGDIRWTDKVFVKSNGDIIDFEGRVVGHINLEDMKGGAE